MTLKLYARRPSSAPSTPKMQKIPQSGPEYDFKIICKETPLRPPDPENAETPRPRKCKNSVKVDLHMTLKSHMRGTPLFPPRPGKCKISLEVDPHMTLKLYARKAPFAPATLKVQKIPQRRPAYDFKAICRETLLCPLDRENAKNPLKWT